MRWLSDPDPWTDVVTAQQAIAGWAHRRPPLGVWAIVPTADGVPAGTVSLGLLPDGDEVEIGWYLHPDSWGRGYAREAARAALDHALANGVCRIWAIMWPHNAASARVATAIEMTDLGVRHDPWYGTPDEPDSRMFRIASSVRPHGRDRRRGR